MASGAEDGSLRMALERLLREREALSPERALPPVQLAKELGLTKRKMNSLLYSSGMLAKTCEKGGGRPRWYLLESRPNVPDLLHAGAPLRADALLSVDALRQYLEEKEVYDATRAMSALSLSRELGITKREMNSRLYSSPVFRKVTEKGGRRPRWFLGVGGTKSGRGEASLGTTEDPPEKGPPEKGPPEKGLPEEGPPEKGLPEKGPPKKGLPEEGPQEKGLPEEGLPEKGPPEKGLPEEGLQEEGPQEKGPQEKGPPEKGLPEEGPQEKGLPEEGPQEKGPQEKGPQEEGPPEKDLPKKEREISERPENAGSGDASVL